MCTRPIRFFRDKNGTVTRGSKGETGAVSSGTHGCGACDECLALDRNTRTVRGAFEATQWPSSLFVTLTYDDDHLPPGGSLRKVDVQLFMKRLKKRFQSCKSNPVRQIIAGEYGDDGRPHYHLILFNVDFRDKYLWRRSDEGFCVFRSPLLEDLWPCGFSEFSDAAPANIAYVYKYIAKKKPKRFRPTLVDEDTGLVLEPEFVEASRNPGIGAFLKDSSSLLKGYLVFNGVRYPLPRYYKDFLSSGDSKHCLLAGRQVLNDLFEKSFDKMAGSVKFSDTVRDEFNSNRKRSIS